MTARATERTYRNILDSTTGILFFATPHRGSGAASIANLLLNVAKYTGNWRPGLIGPLTKDSEYLSNLSQDFKDRLSAIKVKSFYETVRTEEELIKGIPLSKRSALVCNL